MNSTLRPALIAAIVVVVAFDLACLWQYQTGAYHSELGGHPNEAAHYLSGILFPSRLAEQYRQSYPAIGLSNPGFPAVESGWMALFGNGRRATLMLMAAFATLLAIQLFRALRDEFGDGWAAFGGLLLLCQPLVIEAYTRITPDVLGASLMLAAAITWGRYLERERARDALGFGALAGFAVFVQTSGIVLVMQASLALLFTRRWPLLKRPATWGAVALAAAIAGPWLWKFDGLKFNPVAWDFVGQAIPLYLGKCAATFGPILVVLFAIGVVAKIRSPGPHVHFWAAMGALVFSAILPGCMMPLDLEPRHLISALPPAVMFIIAGLDALRRRSLGRRDATARPVSHTEFAACVVLGISGVWLAHRLNPPEPKKWSGFKAMAEAVVEDPALTSAAVLVSSDARGEGMFLSELAMLEQRPGHVVRLATTELATSDRQGERVRLKYESDEELMAWFKGSGKDVGAVVVDASMPETDRTVVHDQLIRACEDHSDFFWLVSSAPVVRQGVTQRTPVKLYQVRRATK